MPRPHRIAETSCSQRELPRIRGGLLAISLALACGPAAAVDNPGLEPGTFDSTHVVAADEGAPVEPLLTIMQPSRNATNSLDDGDLGAGAPLPSIDEPSSAADAAEPDAAQQSSSIDPFDRPPGRLLRPLSEVSVSLETPDDVKDTPSERMFARYGLISLAPRRWNNEVPDAAAYRFSSNPLWFEDPNLERCGYSCGCCCQPVVSGLHFLGNTALIPYRMAAEPLCSTVPAKPFCPPGRKYGFCENYLPPPSVAGAAAQAAAATGLIFLIP